MVTKDHINELVMQLSAIFPGWNAAIQSTEQANNLKRVWHAHMNEMGLTPEDLNRGIGMARHHESDFLPSLGQFVSWCGRGNIQPKNVAWQTAQMGSAKKITDPLIYEAARRTGSYDIQTRPERDVKPLFVEHYQQVISESLSGTEFTIPEDRRIESEPEPKPAQDPEVARKTLDEMYAMLDGSIKGDSRESES